jgi:hypothetical protein
MKTQDERLKISDNAAAVIVICILILSAVFIITFYQLTTPKYERIYGSCKMSCSLGDVYDQTCLTSCNELAKSIANAELGCINGK